MHHPQREKIRKSERGFKIQEIYRTPSRAGEKFITEFNAGSMFTATYADDKEFRWLGLVLRKTRHP